MAWTNHKYPDVKQLVLAVRSFGFICRSKCERVIVLWAGGEEVFIARKLPRQGFFELNRTNKILWSKYGALGIPVFEYIGVAELIKWFYDLALETPEIIDGQVIPASQYSIADFVAGKLARTPLSERLQKKANKSSDRCHRAAKRRREKQLIEDRKAARPCNVRRRAAHEDTP